jgi:peptidoglycan/LPS O-acetylase OafA/YrhL
LDGLRALAACYVVVFHAVLGFEGAALSGAWRLLRRLCAFGHEAVAVFIVLSGYCLMLPVLRNEPETLPIDLRSFLRRRAWRILPPYYAALGLSLLLLAVVPVLRAPSGTLWDDSLPGLDPGAIGSHVLLIHNWVPAWAMQINGPLWSVASEWQIYFFFPLLLLPVWRRWGMVAALLVAGAVGYAPLLFARGPAMLAIPWYLLLFGLGMAAASIGFAPSPLSMRLRADVPWRRVSAALWLGCAAFGLLLGRVWFAHKPVTDLMVGLAMAALLVSLGIRAQAKVPDEQGWFLQVLQSRPLLALGHFSYSLYLTHLPVLALCYFALAPLRLPPGLLSVTLLMLGGLASLLFAYAFYFMIERHFIVAGRSSKAPSS